MFVCTCRINTALELPKSYIVTRLAISTSFGCTLKDLCIMQSQNVYRWECIQKLVENIENTHIALKFVIYPLKTGLFQPFSRCFPESGHTSPIQG
jgi:hypothetical protein